MKDGIKGFSGKLDGAIYYYHPRLKRTLMRKAPEMPIQPQNIVHGNIARNIKALDPSEGYRSDFKTYLSALRDFDDNVTYPSWYSLYVKMLWAMQAQQPDVVDLKTITKQQVYQNNLPCVSVKNAVEAGLLPVVNGYQYLDHQM